MLKPQAESNNRAGRISFFPADSPPVEAVLVDEKVFDLGLRAVKKQSKVKALRLAVSMMDLTTLEGRDTKGKVKQLCHMALRPLERDPLVPSCAAVCVYPNFVSVAKKELISSNVRVASVATVFPSGQSPLDIKLQDARKAVEFGADEIDMVIDRGALLLGDYNRVYDEIAQTKEVCGDVWLKVILETGELGSYELVRKASDLAMAAGADFIKTSTGKIQPAATLGVTLVMCEAIRDFFLKTGIRIGMKPAGGIRTSKQALHYLVLLYETLGDAWMNPHLFRFGASTLLHDVLMQLEKERRGIYPSTDDLLRA